MKSKQAMVIYSVIITMIVIIAIFASVKMYHKFCSTRVGSNAMCNNYDVNSFDILHTLGIF
jgi:hypothetical protein